MLRARATAFGFFALFSSISGVRSPSGAAISPPGRSYDAVFIREGLSQGPKRCSLRKKSGFIMFRSVSTLEGGVSRPKPWDPGSVRSRGLDQAMIAALRPTCSSTRSRFACLLNACPRRVRCGQKSRNGATAWDCGFRVRSRKRRAAGGDLIVRPVRRRTYRLKELLRQINSKNIHAEVDAGAPVGRECW